VASIVVAGGGVAGLVCAWRLRRAGHEVEVLERESEAGGRMRSRRRDGFRLDLGAQFVASGYRNLHAVAAALGLGERVVPLEGARDAVLRAGRFHRADPSAPAAVLASGLLSPRARLRLLRLVPELARHWRRLDPWRPEAAAALDQADLPLELERLVGAEAYEFLLAPSLAATFAAEPQAFSSAFVLLMLRFLAGGFRLQSFDEGPGLLTRALAAEVPVHTGCEVLGVETETEGARIRYRRQGRERSVLADAAVVALPACDVAAACPKLTPEERGYFESVRYTRGIVAHLLLERPPPALAYTGVAFPRREGLDLYGLAVDHVKPGAAPRGAGLLNTVLTEEAAARLWDAADERIASCVLGSLARTPIGRLRPLGCAVQRWAPMLPLFRPGHLVRLERFGRRMERSPRLAFAGDHLVGPHAEGAVTSGMRAATEVCRSL
jgi:oxygen-dependent protoporphyrinogen oxidase